MPINDLKYTYEVARDKALMEQISVCEMVRVISVRSDMSVDLQPLCHKLVNGTYIQQPPLLNVPTVAIAGGGYVFKPVYKTGDIGIVIYCDHDKDNFLMTGKDGRPNTLRLHDKSDAFFLGGITTGNLPSGLYFGNSGNFIQITDTGLKISGDVTIDGNVVINNIVFKTHTHSGVMAGGSSTGGPQ